MPANLATVDDAVLKDRRLVEEGALIAENVLSWSSKPPQVKPDMQRRLLEFIVSIRNFRGELSTLYHTLSDAGADIGQLVQLDYIRRYWFFTEPTFTGEYNF